MEGYSDTMVQTPAGKLPPAGSAESLPPVIKPKKKFPQLLGEILSHGGPGYLQFAITNICNAKCDFCGFAVDRFDPRQRRSVSLEEARMSSIFASRIILAICCSWEGSLWFTKTFPKWCAMPPSGAFIR